MFKRLSLIGSVAVLLIAAIMMSLPMSVGAQDPVPSPTPQVTELGSGSINVSFWSGLTGSDGNTLNATRCEVVDENPEYANTNENMPWGTK